MRIFCLEDEIEFYPRNQIQSALLAHDVTYATSKEEAIAKFKGPYDLMLLDHDMEGNYEYRPNYPNTGFAFLKWLTDQPFKIGCQVILHSHNPVGRTNMRNLLASVGVTNVDECPFGPKYVELLKEIK